MYSKKIENILKRNKIKIGNRILIKKGKEIREGLLMPKTEKGDKNCVVIKEDSGYNIGIRYTKGMKIKKSRKKEPKAIEKEEEFELGKWKLHKKKLKYDPKKPTISILHTGGTIASKVDYKTGGVIASFEPSEIVSMFPELGKIVNIHSRLIRNMSSEDMRFTHYNLIARDIKQEIKKKVDGIIITHGTDTMAYSAAALAFILQDLSIPVILVGAQRSSDRGSSDAGSNLIAACKFIANSDFSEVAICMHENMEDNNCLILPSCKTRKFHTSRRDAFRPVNDLPWAKVNYKTGKIDFIKKNYIKRDKKRVLKIKPIKEKIKVGILKIHTNMYAKEFENYKGFNGLVIEGTGLGHFPSQEIDNYTKESKKIFNAVKKLIKNGTLVVMAPQTVYGSLQMNVYAPGREIQNIGVLGNYSDMLPETTFIKLAWLLSNYPKNKVKELISKNLKGEISEKINPRTFLY